MRYSWDPDKAASNLEKHGVSFEEAMTVLDNPLTEFAPQLDYDEPRLQAIGPSARRRVLFVVCVEPDDDHLRIISARPANARERKTYEKRTKA